MKLNYEKNVTGSLSHSDIDRKHIGLKAIASEFFHKLAIYQV
jgi:hypothetical protein